MYCVCVLWVCVCACVCVCCDVFIHVCVCVRYVWFFFENIGACVCDGAFVGVREVWCVSICAYTEFSCE